MKQLLFYLSLLFLCVTCSSLKGTKNTEYFECYTPTPHAVLDSIATTHQLSVPSTDKWGGSYYLSSDSTATVIRHYITKKDKMTYIFSVTTEIIDTTARDTVIVRYRKEK